MTSNKKVRHISTLDTDLYIHKITYSGLKSIKVRASLIDRKTEYVYETATFSILRADLKNWRIVV